MEAELVLAEGVPSVNRVLIIGTWAKLDPGLKIL